MTGKKSLTIVQMNDSHAYFDLHQEMFWQGDHALYCPQGVPQKYGINRENSSEHIIDALRTYLARHSPIHTELRGTFVAV